MKLERSIEIKSPLNGQLIGQVEAMTKEQVNETIRKAKEGLKEWKAKPLYERVEYLYKVADLLLEKESELTELLIKEVGKDKKSAQTEVIRTADLIRFTADTAKNMHSENRRADRFPGGNKGKIAIIDREPVGVVLAVSPFNYPVNLAASKIAPALVGGNTVIFKPATQGSYVVAYLQRFLLKQAYQKAC